METKNLKHRKRQKSNTSGTKKRNADVLVVPPDILKKLGISIGSTATLQHSNVVNTPSNTDIVYNESVAEIPTAIINKKSSESSILETASLMKKSVFLSPTFVPTIANMISGEVEISNVQNHDDSKMLSESFTSENIKEKIVDCESISNNKDHQQKFNDNGNLQLNVEFSDVQHKNSHVIKNVSKDSVIHNQQIVLENPKITNHIDFEELPKLTDYNSESVGTNNHSDLLLSEKLNTSKSTEIFKGTVHSKCNEDLSKISDIKTEIDISKTSVTENVISISLENNANHITESGADDNLYVIRKSQFPIDEGIRSRNLEENITKVKLDEIDDNFSNLKRTEIHIDKEYENDTISLKSSQNQNKCTDIQNELFSLEGRTFQIEQDGGVDNFSSAIKNILSIEQAKNNIISVQEIQSNLPEVQEDFMCFRSEDMKEVGNNTISLRDTKKENEFAVDDCNLVSIQGSELVIKEKEIISIEDKMIQEKYTGFKKETTDFEDTLMKIKHGEKDNNAYSLDGTELQLNKTKDKNNSSLDKYFNNNKDYIKDVMAVDGSLNTTSRETNTQSDLTVDNIVASVAKVAGNISHAQNTMVSENIIQIQECKRKDIDNNKNILYGCTQHLCNGSLKDTIQQNLDSSKPTESIPDMVVPVKIVQKINIISEEIIPPLDFKDLRKSHSPIIKSLTPVPLNSIITPKRNNDYSFEIKAVDKRSSTVLAKQTGVLAAETKNSSISSSPDQFDAICDVGTIETSLEENVTKQNSDKLDLKALHYLSVIEKGDLKNNNDILNSVVIEASADSHSEHLITNDCKMPMCNELIVMKNDKSNRSDLSNSQINGVHCSDVAIGNVDTMQHNNIIDVDQNMKINCDNGALGSKSSPDDNMCKNNFKANQDKKDSKDRLDNKKKKKKKVINSKVINVRGMEDKAFCNNEINNIVKSSKENSDTNANLDKVKEIAEYIKKYAHIYKDNTRIINKVENKKGTMNSKSNMIKSKLCIQGVEKPGGNKGRKEVSDKMKVLKTYTKAKKHNEPHTSKQLGAHSIPVLCNVGEISETELNIINISMSCKAQEFCLCYDFGRLDACIYENSYEHIHFWRHDDTADLESIFSIYNDEEFLVNDRTKLDALKVCEVTETNTITSNICWNYFHVDKETSDQMHLIDNSAVDESNNIIINPDANQVEDMENKEMGLIKVTSDEISKNDLNIDVADDVTQTDSSMNSIINTCLPNESSSSHEVITIVEVVDNENVSFEIATTDSEMTTVPKENVFYEAERSHSIPKENVQSKSSQLLEGIKKKRSLPAGDTNEEPCPKKNVKCGVCNKLLSENEWNKHVMKKHNYIAWKAGQSFNFDNPDLLNKLRNKLEMVGSLKCPNCHTQTRKFDKFIAHIKFCMKQKECSSRRASSSKDLVICGVCHQRVHYLSWNKHIGKEHNYLAWIEGQNALDIEDEAAVARHLQNIIKCNGSLECNKCGLNRKRAKLYLSHIETCDGSETHMDDSTVSADMDSTAIQEDTVPSVSDKKTVKCGVCKQEIPVSQWTKHIGKEHNYLAWEDGSTALNLDDEEMVRNHLQEFIRHNGGLRCYKCGLNRKRVKLYLSHIQTCDGEGVNFDESLEDTEQCPSDEKIIECGVCHAKVLVLGWHEHIGREHNYLAWKHGDNCLDVSDQDAVKEHLLEIIRKYGGLICYKCGLNRKRAKLYLAHIQTCDGSESQLDQSSDVNSTVNSTQIEISIDETEKIVQCGVCDQHVSMVMWIEHIGREHKYLAWQKGQVPLDLENNEMVKAHLINISRDNDGLICYLCHVIKKYPKTFLQHIKDCDGTLIHQDYKIKNEQEISSFDISDVKTDTVICGVCNKVVITAEWMKHIEDDHDYMGWLQGRPPLDVNDPAAVQRHLMEMSKCTGGLKCKNCGLIRKYVKTYLEHIDYCSSSGKKMTESAVMMGSDLVTCAVCSETMEPKDWRDHAMKKHYNVAWLDGTNPIEINNPYGVEPYIKEYQQRHNNKLVCKTCGISRVSAVGFYAHVIICGKTDEETEKYKSMCDICNCKYLRIYKSQHMTMHREKEYAMERKLLIAKEKELKKEEDEPVEIVGGRRKAAEKAKTVIEKYTSIIGDGTNCSKCGFNSNVESEMLNHVCVEKQRDGNESDESVDIDESSEEEDDDTDIDSNISDEEREARDRELTKSKRHGDSSSAYKVQRLPYQIKNLSSYMRKSAQEFIALHLTDEDIFNQYRAFNYEIISEADMPKYMPPVEESCKIRYSENDDWTTYKRFEAKLEEDLITIFTGSCIQSMCWVPSYVKEHDTAPAQEYLSVLSSLTSDTPRHFWYEKPARKPALIQIWDCGNFTSGVPELAMGLALDCGTIWAFDWCPSGARDVFDAVGECNEIRRLGLLAVASANGSAYVFAVPHPCTIKEKGKFYNLNPVVELRLAMDANRKVYQATAIKWSTQKGHAHIVVGYADGTIAYFDLRNESPLLKTTENNMDIIYPYHDERSQNMCIEDVDVFPTVEGVRGVRGAGAVVSGSVSGAGSRLLHTHAAATRVLFPPHWPAALLAGDDNLVSQSINELEWYGAGRRVGAMRAMGGCAWCGRVAAASAPLVRLARTHPAYDDLHRQVIAIFQMVPFGNKRKRKNDELSMIMEPLTYDDAVLKYGLEFKQVTAKDKNTQQKLSGIARESFPERFPLADVISMAFCPALKHHHKLAMATHAGLIFIMTV